MSPRSTISSTASRRAARRWSATATGARRCAWPMPRSRACGRAARSGSTDAARREEPMADLLLKNHAPDGSGLVHRVTPASAGWDYVGFELYRLAPGQGVEASTGEREVCLVLVGGKARI